MNETRLLKQEVAKLTRQLEKMKERERQYRAMGDTVPYGVWMCDKEGVSLYVSDSFLEFLGISWDEYIQRGFEHLIHPDDLEADRRDWQACRNTGQKRDFERRILGADGDYHYVLTRGEPLYDSRGNITSWVGLNLDIDSRKKIEREYAKLLEEVKNERERIEDIITTVPGVVWEAWGNPASAEAEFDLVSDHVERLTGYSPEDWLRVPAFLLKMIYPDDLKRVKDEISHVYEEGDFGKVEFRLLRKDAKVIWVELHCAVIHNDKNRPVGMRGVIIEITQLKIESERKDEFLSIASHELKTPITSIRGFTQILDRQLEDLSYKDIRLYLGKVNNYVDKLMNLISELLDISKIQTGKFQLEHKYFNITETIEEAISDTQAMTVSHKIILEAPVNLVIRGDKMRVSQVLINLLSNAIKYSPHANQVVVRVMEDHGGVTVGVQDFGIGIPKSKQRNIFQRYYRVHEASTAYAGLGIGLYISYKIIQRHGGEMWVESQEGKGSTFNFWLPGNTLDLHTREEHIRTDKL